MAREFAGIIVQGTQPKTFVTSVNHVRVVLKSIRLIKKLEKMSFHAVIPLSFGSNLP